MQTETTTSLILRAQRLFLRVRTKLLNCMFEVATVAMAVDMEVLKVIAKVAIVEIVVTAVAPAATEVAIMAMEATS